MNSGFQLMLWLLLLLTTLKTETKLVSADPHEAIIGDRLKSANAGNESPVRTLVQQVIEQPADVEVLVHATSVVLMCRFEGAVGTPSWTRDGLLLVRNHSSFAGPRLSVITNSRVLLWSLYVNLLQLEITELRYLEFIFSYKRYEYIIQSRK